MRRMNRLLHIGEVGETVGLNPKTIRYYEEIGLLPKPRRSEVIHGKGYRLYTQEDLNRLLFIKQAKLLDISLAQIKELLVSIEEGCCGSARPHLAILLEQKLTEIEERIQELKQLHHHLNWLKQETTRMPAQKALSSCASTASPSGCVFIEYPAQGAKRLPKGENAMTDHIPLTTVEQAGECCEPLCPDMCGPSGNTPTQGPIKTKTVTAKDKVVKLTKAGAQRLFNGEDNKIFTRDDLIETTRNGRWIKVAGRCSGQIWHVRRDEIIKIDAVVKNPKLSP